MIDTISSRSANSVTPSDSTILAPTLNLYIGTGGDIAVMMLGDSYNESIPTSSIVFKNVPSGTVLPIRCTQVMSTGTTASDIIALY